MTETVESSAEPTTATGPRRVDDRHDRPGRLSHVLAWVGITAGVLFIVVVIFFSGFVLGRSSGGHRGYDVDRDGSSSGQTGPGGMMGPGYTGPGGTMGPGYNGPGGMMGPGYNGPGGMMGPGFNGPGGMMGPGSNGPGGMMGPGFNGPGGMMGPGSNGPGGMMGPSQSPRTTAPSSPRP